MISVFYNKACRRWREFSRWLVSVCCYEHWMVGIVDQPIANAPTWKNAPPIRWVEPFGKRRYLADPFPWPGSADTMMCEEYDIATRRGHIAVLKLAGGNIIDEIRTDFGTDAHMSFPFVFLHDGHVYALPECCASRRLTLYRWHEQQAAWEIHAVIFDDRQVADAVLTAKDGLFWISYTDVAAHPHDNLHLIYASDLVGPWTAHPANPVRRGRDVSRNGGAVFAAHGKLYRPAQDCSRVYGGALRIMEITRWTVSDYEEQEMTCITPTSPAYPDGFHTLSAWGDKCLVDGMRLVFSWRLLGWKVRRRMRTRF